VHPCVCRKAAVEHLDGIEVCGRTVGVVRSQAHTQLFIGGCGGAFDALAAAAVAPAFWRRER
jgi:hypothetical protein